MSGPDFTIKQGDTAPAISAQLLDGNDPIDLEDGIVAFRMEHDIEDVSVAALCTRVDIPEGRIAYTWREGDTDVVGRYSAEFIVDYDYPESIAEFDVDETFPSDEYLDIRVTESLDSTN